jgi:hypothetical protein
MMRLVQSATSTSPPEGFAASAPALERAVVLTREQIAELDEVDARQRLNEARSRPKD